MIRSVPDVERLKSRRAMEVYEGTQSWRTSGIGAVLEIRFD